MHSVLLFGTHYVTKEVMDTFARITGIPLYHVH